MKKLIVVIVCLGFLVLPLSVNAESCERYWDELTDQCFITTIDEIDFTACFSDSVFGPCPGGQVVLSYVDIQVIDDVEYEGLKEIDLRYLTDYNYVYIEDLVFILTNGRLISLPEDPLIFDIVQKD